MKSSTISTLFALSLLLPGTLSCTFTISNNCPHTIWPGTLAGAGTPQLPATGFRLDPGQTARLPAPPRWSGRIWARTGCTFDGEGAGTCQTGDCGGRMECGGVGALPPTTLFEITLGEGNDKDYYDVSLVDGYNLPVVATPTAAAGSGCNATGCVADLNSGCPKELQVEGEGAAVIACKSACEAFGLDQYCCSGEYANPTACKPSFYSTVFKAACPRAYSYAFDDGTSTFTCKADDYFIVFCPTINGLRRSNGFSSAQPTHGNQNQDGPHGQPTHRDEPRSQPTPQNGGRDEPRGQPTHQDGDRYEPQAITSSGNITPINLCFLLFLVIFF